MFANLYTKDSSKVVCISLQSPSLSSHERQLGVHGRRGLTLRESDRFILVGAFQLAAHHDLPYLKSSLHNEANILVAILSQT